MTTPNSPQPFDAFAVSRAQYAVAAAMTGEADAASTLIAAIVDGVGMPGVYDAVFVWCATFHARTGHPFGVHLTLTYVHPETGQPIPESEAAPTLVWASHVIQAYVARDKARFEDLLRDLGEDREQIMEHLTTMVEHVAAHVRLAESAGRAALS
ncbi:hypothetical protein ACU635_43755 [[Actinomadura] parvosata]|uniref:hypothetical protein n=1 Tax=[Actinomadura] parvosata TaxID=1955412 RepID=UPI00406C6011